MLGIFVFLTKMSFAANRKADTLSKDSLLFFPDDPIASMLDSLARLKFFEKASPTITKNKYGFVQDHVPYYSDSIYALRLAKLDAESPFDLVYNQAVQGYIELYAMRKREMVSRMLGLAHLYFPMMEETLDKYDLPLELKYLAIVESALNPAAHSRAGAMGLWQFMYGTGKMYDLKVSSYVDERCNPIKATVAACEYMQFLYDMFGDWQMVLAAYNSGPGTVSKAIRRSGGKNTYWEIRPYLPRETQGYVPAFIAVNYVMNYAEEHNLYATMPKLSYYDVDTIEVKQQLSFDQISKVLDIPVEYIQYLNPCYRRNTIPFSEEKCYSVCLPKTKIGSFITNENAIYDFAKNDSTMQLLAAPREETKIHIVKKGEHLGKISAKYGCTAADLQAWNQLKSAKLRTGQRLTIYVPIKNNSATAELAKNKTAVSDTSKVVKTTNMVSKTKAADSTSVNKEIDDVKFKFYTVQKGDSLWSIAQNHGITIDQIKKWNNFDNAKKILPGQKIKIIVNG